VKAQPVGRSLAAGKTAREGQKRMM